MRKKRIFFNWAICAALAAGFWMSAPAFASVTMGETSELATDDSGNANVLIAQSTTLAQAATLQSLSIYAPQVAGNLYLGVYDATGPSGGPGSLVATTASFTPVAGWNTANVTTPVALQPGTYWLAYFPSSNNFHTAADADSSSSGVYYSHTFGSLPSTFSASPSTSTWHWSLYATLATASGVTMGDVVGHSATDSGNNGVLIAQSATLSQASTVQSMSIYVLNAAGNLRLGIYDATGPDGKPGNLVAATASFTPTTGWNTVNVTTPAALTAGTYWLAYLPTDNSLTTGYAADGTSSGVYYSYGSGALPSTFSTSPSTTTSHWSLYASLDKATGITIGDTTAHSTTDNGNNGVLIAQSATLSQSATIDSLSIYVLTAAGNLRLGVYDASGPSGKPGQLMATTASFTPTTGWNTANVVTPIALPAGTYWLAYLPTDNSFTTASIVDSTSSGVYYFQGAGALPSVFSGSPSATTSHWSFYANLTTSGGPSFTLGQTPFAASSSWNTAIPTTGVTYTNVAWPTSTGYNYSVSWDSYSAGIYMAAPTDPLVAVTYPAGWGFPGGTVYVRMPAAADGAPGTDGELLVIDGTTVHNFWEFDRTSSTTATASSYARTDVLAGTGWGSPSPFFGAGITAAGSSQLAGILVQAETDAGEIHHALNIRGDYALVAPGAVGEAIASDGGTTGGILQEGQRYAIPYSTTMPSGLSTLGQKVFRAMQNYGAFVTDVASGVTTIGAQQNAYDSTTMTDLWHDCGAIIPLLKKVQ